MTSNQSTNASFSVMSAAAKVAHAQRWLMRNKPMWGSLLLRLKIRPTRRSDVNTMVTDGRAVEYCESFVDQMSVEETVTCLAHEVGHCAMKHVFRKGSRDHDAFEEAADHVLNLQLLREGFRFPSHISVHSDPQFAGMSVEQVYPIILAKHQQQEQEQQNSAPKGSSGSSASADADADPDDGDGEGESESSDDGDAGSDSKKPASMGEMAEPGSLGDGDEGEEQEQSPDDAAEEQQEDDAQPGQEGDGEGDGADEGQPSDDAEGSEGGQGEGREEATGEGADGSSEGSGSGSMSEADVRALENDWGQAASAAAQQALARGHGSAALQREILQSNKEPISFEDYLRYFLHRCKDRSSLSWSRQSRRTIVSGPYLPARRGQQIGALVVVIDTSGSIGAEALAKFGVQVRGAQQDLKPKMVIVLYADDEVANEVRFEEGDEFIIRSGDPKGGGGTDFRPAFNRIVQIRDEEGIDIAGVLYLTDLEGDMPTSGDAIKHQYPPTLWCFDSSTCYSLHERQALLNDVTFGEVAELQN